MKTKVDQFGNRVVTNHVFKEHELHNLSDTFWVDATGNMVRLLSVDHNLVEVDGGAYSVSDFQRKYQLIVGEDMEVTLA